MAERVTWLHRIKYYATRFGLSLANGGPGSIFADGYAETQRPPLLLLTAYGSLETAASFDKRTSP